MKKLFANKKRLIVLAIVVIVILRVFASCRSTVTIKESEPTYDFSHIQVDVSGYDITSTPIGVGEYSIVKNAYSDTASVLLTVKKNTATPWCGAVTVVWELFDEVGNSIGKETDRSDSLLEGRSSNLEVFFKMNENDKPTYNDKEIYKLKLISLTEEDNLHEFKKSNFLTKKYHLEDYIEDGKIDEFRMELANVRAEYLREEFPEENTELDILENSVGAATPAPTPTPVPTAKAEPTQKPKSSISAKSNASSNKLYDYKKYRDNHTLKSGERIFVAGRVDAIAVDQNVLIMLDGQTYIMELNGKTGIYMRDIVEEEGGMEQGTYIGMAGRFSHYWTGDDGTRCAVLDEGWFTPVYLYDGEREYVSLPMYNGRDLYSSDIE